MGIPIIITCSVIVWYSTTTPGCRDGKGIEHSRVYVYNMFGNGITLYVVMIKAIIPYFPFSCTDDKPSLLDLRKFPGKDHKINVMERIGVNYPDFGMFLLQDSDGSKVSALELTWQRASLPICRDIMTAWLQGKGKTPVTYATLLHCLHEADLHNLAKDIEDVLIS